MKKNLLLYLLFICLLPAIGFAQTTINFDNEASWTQDAGVSTLGSYGNHSYSENGFTVEGTKILRNSTSAQDGFDGAIGAFSIRIRNENNAKIVITIANGGVSNFSCDVRRWDGTPIPDYTVRFSTNGGTDWTNLPNIDGNLLATSNWFTYNGTINNGNNNIKIEIANTGTTERIMVDNFSWTAFSSAPVPTLIVSANTLNDFTYLVENGPSQSQTFTIAGTYLEGDVNITPPANFEISFDGTNYQTTAIILNPSDGTLASTSIFARLVSGLAVGNYSGNITIGSDGVSDKTIAINGSVTAPPDYSIPYTENFISNLGDFTPFSETGAQEWVWRSYGENTYAYMNGYQGGAQENIDWLISPAFDFRNLNNLLLTFTEAVNYLTSYDDLKLMVSTNYTGSVANATWIELSITGRSPGNWEFVVIDAINLDNYAGEDEVTFAFKYISTTAGAGGWEISQFAITGDQQAALAPSNHVTNFSATSGTITETSIALAWEENQGEVPAANYLIKASTAAITAPNDSVAPVVDTDLTDGEGEAIVQAGITTYTFDNCAPGTLYNFAIYPFNGSGEGTVFKTTDAPATSATTLAELFAPVIAPEAGFYSTEVEVNITCTTPEAKIYFTTNGSEPNELSTEFEGPFSLTDTTTIKAIAILNNRKSEITEATFDIEIPGIVNVANPLITPKSGIYYNEVVISINCETDNAIIYFTTDNTTPTNASTMYEGEFTINKSGKVKAIAYVEENSSTVASETYQIIVLPDSIATPVITPADGLYNEMVEISIECTTIGANIYYTTDGTTPDTSSTLYDESFTINKTAWIQAIAIIGPMSSSVANGYFDIIIPVAEPIISPAEGTYLDSVSVSIACETEGALIYYTTDGYEPTTESTLYEGAFTLTESAWVSAIAVLDTVVSNLTTAFFTIEAKPIEVAKPLIQPEQTEFQSELQINIECATENASIYYTTDGTTPDNNSTIFTESFTINQTTTIKAIAYFDDFSSVVAEKTYTLKEVAAPVEVATLAELRAGATDGTTYAFTGTATVTFAMDFRDQKYIQDQTAAILIDDNNGIITENFEIGDGISRLKGRLSDYNGLLQFLPDTNAEKVNATIEIQAQTISTEELKTNFEQYESQLIKILDVTFAESGQFKNGTNYSISSNGETSILRTHFYNMDYIGTAIPDKNVNITGIALWHYEEAKIVPRKASDIEDASGINKSNIDIKIFSNGTQLFVQQINTATDIVEIYRFDGRKSTTHRPNASFMSIDIEYNGLYTVLIKRNGLLIKTEKIQITH